VDVVRKKWLIQRFYWTTFSPLEFVMICGYNLRCSKCKDLNDKERRYINFSFF
jgi:hypothetical protein